MMHDEIIRDFKAFRNPLFHSSVMFRKAAVLQIGGYDESLACSLDWDLYVRLARTERLANLDERLSLKRIHSGQFFVGKRIVGETPEGIRSTNVVKERIQLLVSSA